MQKSFTNFIEQIHHYPDYLITIQLKKLLEDSNIEVLKKLKLLKRGSDLKEVLCQSCDNDHFVPIKIENGKPYCFCSCEDMTRNYLTQEDISTWEFDIEAFLQQLSLKLGIDANIEKMNVKGMWGIGGFSKDDTRHECYYYQGKNFNEVLVFIKQQSSQMRRYIVFTNKQEIASFETDHELLLIEIKGLADIKSKQLVFNKKLFHKILISGFRSVIFKPHNGDLIVNGKRIVTIAPSSPEYYFAEILWKNFNEPVPHQTITNYIYQKTKKSYSDMPDKVCTKRKSKIKNSSIDPDLIDKIFGTTTTLDDENAYIMRNSE